MHTEEDDPFDGTTKKTISVAKNTPAVVTLPGTGGDLHDDDSFSAQRIRKAAQAGRDLGREGRVALMQTIGARFGVPSHGFPTGQSRIYVTTSGGRPAIGQTENLEIRFDQVLRLLSKERANNAAAANLRRTVQLVDVNIFLVLATTARECRGLTARGSNKVDSFQEGGLDFLDQVKNQIGLPRSIVANWTRIVPYESLETHNMVHPSSIPMRDQILGYATVTRLNFKGFRDHVKTQMGDIEGQALLDSLSSDAELVWQAYSFLAHGGAPFDPKKGPRHGQGFGVRSALGYLEHLASQAAVPFDMNAILTTPALHRTDYVKIAKARAMEATFFEHLWKQSASKKDARPQ